MEDDDDDEVLEVTGEEMTGDTRCKPMARQFLAVSFRQRDLSRFSDPQSEVVILGVMIIAMMMI